MIKVKARNKSDKEKARMLGKVANHTLNKLMDIPEFRTKFTEHCILGEPFPRKELEEYFKQILK